MSSSNQVIQDPVNPSRAYKNAVNTATSAHPTRDGLDTHCKLKSKAAHKLFKNNEKYSLAKALEWFLDIYDMQSALRGCQSTRAMDAYKWAMKAHARFQKVKRRNKAKGKIENAARKAREEENKKNKKN